MSATVAIIDYGSGNLASAAKALERAATDAATGQRVLVTARAEDIATAERIVLPGVGAFADCMQGLSNLPGMLDALKDAVVKQARPFLGICVGMQLMAARGLEHGEHKGFGWIPGDVVKLTPAGALKVPHMGWNAIHIQKPAPALEGIPEGSNFYFVHSYYPIPENAEIVATTTDYGIEFASSIGQEKLFACQFHPEKSQAFGLQILKNFGRLVHA